MAEQPRKSYVVRSLSDTKGVPCPCGTAYRVISKADQLPLSVHYVKISSEARAHYHKKLTETYIVIEGEGYLELDGDQVPLKPGVVVTIPPGVVHRAVGDLYINNIVVPAFDPDDEFEV